MQEETKGTDIIYGRNPVLEGLENGVDIEKVFMLNTMKGPYEKQIRYWARERNIPIVKVPVDKLTGLVGNKSHQGTVAFIAPIKYHDLDEFLDNHGEKALKLLLLDGINDVRNIGAIARSALVFGLDGIIISAKNSGRISEDTVKSSAGAILKLPVIRVSSALTGLEALQARGITIVATDLKASDYMKDYTFEDRSVLIMGSEHKGVDRNLLAKVDKTLKIHQATDFDSLNVSVAAGISLYLWSQQ